MILFAALSYAVTQALQGGGKDASSESYKAQATQLIQFGALLENTINRQMLVSNVREYGFDFSYTTPNYTQSGPNSTCTSQVCRMFTTPTSPGLINIVKFDMKFLDPRFLTLNPGYSGDTGSLNKFQIAQILDVGTALPELLLIIEGIRPEICKAINEGLWNDYNSYFESYGNFTFYSGTLTAFPSSFAVLGNEAAFYKGKSAGCIGRESSGYGGDFYYTLIAR